MVKKPLSRGRGWLYKESGTDNFKQELELTKPPSRGRRGEESNVEQEQELKRYPSRGRRGWLFRESGTKEGFEQSAVRHKMSTFHLKLMSLEFHCCSTCLECFPDLSMAGGSTECRHCSQDKHVPKVYTTANNMNPGTVPPQLQVYVQYIQIVWFTQVYHLHPYNLFCRGCCKWRRCLSQLSCQLCQFTAYVLASIGTLVM